MRVLLNICIGFGFFLSGLIIINVFNIITPKWCYCIGIGIGLFQVMAAEGYEVFFRRKNGW